jgi:kynurenine formamidase
MEAFTRAEWKIAEVRSPNLDHPVPVVVARDIPYVANAHRFQTLSIYLPKTSETSILVGTPATALATASPGAHTSRWHVHIHGGAWRDPQLTSASIERAVAHAFAPTDRSLLITAVASINYTLSPFPSHPTLPYEPTRDRHSDASREAKHPDHLHDVLNAFALLRSFGLSDGSYILTGHSCGACISFQSILQSPSYWGLDSLPEPPRPAALIGLNGLYDLIGLVHDLGPTHAHLEGVYTNLQSIAFGKDQSGWSAVSPAVFDLGWFAGKIKTTRYPRLIMLDQSKEDQLVPMNQTVKLEKHLSAITGLEVIRGDRCEGRHAAPWEEGYMIWNTVLDVLKLLGEM